MLSSHMIDLLIWYFGEPTLIYKELQDDFVRNVHGNKDYGGTAIIKFKEKDFLCIIHSRSESPFNFLFELEIIGAKGNLKINTLEEKLHKAYLKKVPSSKTHKTLETISLVKKKYDISKCRMTRQLNFLIKNEGYNKTTELLINDSINGLKLIENILK